MWIISKIIVILNKKLCGNHCEQRFNDELAEKIFSRIKGPFTRANALGVVYSAESCSHVASA